MTVTALHFPASIATVTLKWEQNETLRNHSCDPNLNGKERTYNKAHHWQDILPFLRTEEGKASLNNAPVRRDKSDLRHREKCTHTHNKEVIFKCIRRGRHIYPHRHPDPHPTLYHWCRRKINGVLNYVHGESREGV